MSKKKIVVIGGGNGSAICLEALKKYTGKFDISAVISMSDSGGSSGKLRKEFSTLPPGDIMRAVLSLSKYDYKMLRQIFYKPRFKNTGKLDSHNLGNLFLTLTSQYSKNFLYALEALAQSVEAQGKVYPATLENSDLVAELENGDIIRTEEFIDNPRYNRGIKIKKVWLEPNCLAYIEAQKTIATADYIILSPGSLYTSLIAALLPKGIKEGMAKNKKAKIIYVAGGAYRLDGETGPERLSDFILQLEKYLPHHIDLVIHNNHKLNKKQKQVYQTKKWGVFEFDKENLKTTKIKSLDLEAVDGGTSSEKLAVVLSNIIKSGL
ncbi:MAG TPA: gluconeogenesis factor YvcK family protein [Candidatus Udaeobacter sp.]|nr:gluconeogenesis factor YvcK family protein [Candidatus Udaeobacter sp.]